MDSAEQDFQVVKGRRGISGQVNGLPGARIDSGEYLPVTGPPQCIPGKRTSEIHMRNQKSGIEQKRSRRPTNWLCLLVMSTGIETIGNLIEYFELVY